MMAITIIITIMMFASQEFAENPMERLDIEDNITVQGDNGIQDIESVYDYCRQMCNVDLQVSGFRSGYEADFLKAISG